MEYRQRLFSSLSLIVLAFLLVGGDAFAYSAPMAGRSLIDVLEEFRSRGLPIVYSTDLVESGMEIANEPISSTDQGVVAEILGEFGLGLELAGDALLVVRLTESGADSGTLRGIVKNGTTQRRLPVADVELLDSDRSASTSPSGDFVLTGLAPGDYAMIVRAAGFGEQRIADIRVEAGKTAILVVELQPTPYSLLEKMIVTSSQYTLLHERPASYTFVDREEAENLPDLGGRCSARHSSPTGNGQQRDIHKISCPGRRGGRSARHLRWAASV